MFMSAVVTVAWMSGRKTGPPIGTCIRSRRLPVRAPRSSCLISIGCSSRPARDFSA